MGRVSKPTASPVHQWQSSLPKQPCPSPSLLQRQVCRRNSTSQKLCDRCTWGNSGRKGVQPVRKSLSTAGLRAGPERVWMFDFSSGWDKGALICLFSLCFLLLRGVVASLATGIQRPQISQVKLTFSIISSLFPVLWPSLSSPPASCFSHYTNFPSHATLAAKIQILHQLLVTKETKNIPIKQRINGANLGLFSHSTAWKFSFPAFFSHSLFLTGKLGSASCFPSLHHEDNYWI